MRNLAWLANSLEHRAGEARANESRLPEHEVFVAVLYLRGGALVPSVARLTQLGWVTPQAIAVDALYWAPLPPIPERP